MRPLNHPAARPTVVDYRGEAYWARTRWGDEQRKPKPVPIVLEPLGREILWVDETPCRSAALMRTKGLAAGWDARLSVSHFLDVPPVSGKHKGQWVEKRSVALRLARGDVRAYGIWHLDVEAGKWAFDSAQALEGGAVRTLNAAALAELLAS